MKNKLKVFVGMVIFLPFLLISCGTQDNQIETEQLALKLDESYEFTDSSENFGWTFESDDPKVAEVICGTTIVPHSAGSTTITINKNGELYAYDVTVTESEEDRLLDVPDIKDLLVFLGGSYNALNARGFMTSNDIFYSLVNTDDLLKYANQKSEEGDIPITRRSGRVDNYFLIQGTSTGKYKDSLKKAIEGSLGIDISSVKLDAQVDGTWEDSSTSDNETTSCFTSLLSYNQRIAYNLNLTLDEIREVIMMRESIWNDLTGASGITPEALFEKYGTHIVRTAIMGARMKFDYSLNSEKKKNDTTKLLEISGAMSLQLAAVSGNVDASYTDSKKNTVDTSNVTIKTTVSTVGGPDNYEATATSIDNYSKAYGNWYKGIIVDLKNKDTSNVDLIGVGDSGLIPIWDLLDAEHLSRANALREKYAELVKDNPNAPKVVVSAFSNEVKEEAQPKETKKTGSKGLLSKFFKSLSNLIFTTA